MSSEELTVNYSSFWEGKYIARASRHQITEEQLELLQGLVEVTPEAWCPNDTPIVSLEIVDASGATREYRSAPGDCGGIEMPNVRYAEVAALLDTLRCPPFRTEPATTPLPAGSGCGYRLEYAKGEEYTLTFPTEVTEAGVPYSWTLKPYGGSFSVQILQEGTELPLAEAACTPDTAEKCKSFSHTFEQSGEYILELTVDGRDEVPSFELFADR